MIKKKVICLLAVASIIASTIMPNTIAFAENNEQKEEMSEKIGGGVENSPSTEKSKTDTLGDEIQGTGDNVDEEAQEKEDVTNMDDSTGVQTQTRINKNTRAAGDVTIDSTNFPDDVFRAWVTTTFDTDKNDVLSVTEMEKRTAAYLSNKGITSLEGIKNFKNLNTLNCNGNQLTSLDVSGMGEITRLDVKQNQLATLDISNASKLANFYAQENKLTSINMSGTTALYEVTLSDNPLTSIDFTDSPNLSQLTMRSTNLTSINLTNNKKLAYLTVTDNNLTSIDLTQNTELLEVVLSNFGGNTTLNQLESVDVSKCPKLKVYNVAANKIKSFDLSHNPEITRSYLNDNQIESADFSNKTKLQTLDLKNNVLKSLKLTGASNLSTLELNKNNLEQLDLSTNTSLKTLYVKENQFQNIDLKANTSLTTVRLSDNKLKSLDVKANVNLTSLELTNNLLETLDVTANTNLSRLYTDGNALPMLDLSLNTKLSRDDIGTQKIESGLLAKKNNQYTFDFSAILPESEFANVTVPSATSFDGNTGIATFDALPIDNIVKYTYDTKKHPMNVEVTAKLAFTVTFDTQGGSSLASEDVIDGGFVSTEEIPTREGHVFKGWFKEEECVNEWDMAKDTVTDDITLFAKWEEVKPADKPGDIVIDIEKDASVDMPATKEEIKDAVLTEKEKQDNLTGTNVNIKVVVKRIPEATDDIIKDALEERKDGAYFDIAIYKKIGEQPEVKVDVLNKAMRFVIDVPKELYAAEGVDRVFEVMRIHGGQVDFLKDLDTDDKTVTIETNRFSTYVLCYTDSRSTDKPTDDPTDKPTDKPADKPNVKPNVKPSAKPTAKPNTDISNVPQTGDTTNMIGLISLIGISLLVVVFTLKNRKRLEKK